MFAATLAAPFQMSAQSRRAAHRDCVHDAPVLERDGMMVQIVLAMTAEHVRHFQARLIHGQAAGLAGRRISGGSAGAGKQIQRTGSGQDGIHGHAQVARRGVQAAMTQQHLNRPHIGSAFEQMDGEGVAPMPISA